MSWQAQGKLSAQENLPISSSFGRLLHVQGIEKPQLIWQALPQRLARREFPSPPNRVSDRQGFLSEIINRGTARRGPRCSSLNGGCGSSFGSTERGSRLFPLGWVGSGFRVSPM